jgi:hypothetical protein
LKPLGSEGKKLCDSELDIDSNTLVELNFVAYRYILPTGSSSWSSCRPYQVDISVPRLRVVSCEIADGSVGISV